MISSRAGSRAALASVLGLCAALVAHPAAAQTDDAATAQALFDDAKKALDSGDFTTACPKFAESQRLDPGTGTLTALALCHEKQGKTASAWAEYIEVVNEASSSSKPTDKKRGDFAKQRAAELEPKLSKLTITVDPETTKLPGLTIKRDNQTVRQASWGTALPVDPGAHTIEAIATGKQRFTSQVDVGANADSKSVLVPALDDEVKEGPGPGDKETPKANGESGESPTPSSGGGGGRTVGLVIGGAAGGAGIVAGSIFGILAISKSSAAKSDCPGNVCPGSLYGSAQSINSDAKTFALISDISWGVAVVGVGVGAVLFFTSNNGSPAQAPAPAQASKNIFQVAPFVNHEGGGAALYGTF